MKIKCETNSFESGIVLVFCSCHHHLYQYSMMAVSICIGWCLYRYCTNTDCIVPALINIESHFKHSIDTLITVFPHRWSWRTWRTACWACLCVTWPGCAATSTCWVTTPAPNPSLCCSSSSSHSLGTTCHSSTQNGKFAPHWRQPAAVLHRTVSLPLTGDNLPQFYTER